MCIKKLFCNHEYKSLSSYKKNMGDGVDYDLQEIFIMYCPKCRKEIEVLKHRYDALIGKQKVDEQHRQFKYDK